MVVEFDGVPASGCTVITNVIPNSIACTSSPAHVGAATSVARVRNPDTRTGYLPVTGFQFSGGADRMASSLLINKTTIPGCGAILAGDIALKWTCAGCDASHPARIYRAQSAQFNLYLENYNGGLGGCYDNSGAMTSHAAANDSYFWVVE